MQISAGDAGDRFHSLDDIYYYGGQLGIQNFNLSHSAVYV